MDEASLIPYKAADLSAARMLVLAAHPDDEILGAGGTLALNAAGVEAIRIWIATDGTRQEGAEPAADYGERRRDESRRAAKVLGLEPPLFGSLPDRELAASAGALAAALDALILDFQPDLVFCPSPVEIHPDHRALAEVLYEKLAASRPGDPDHDRLRFLRLAFYEISHPLLPDTLVDIASVSRVKEEALASYASQQAVRDYARAIGGLNAYRRLTLEGEGPVEAFRVVDYAEASTRSLEEFRRSIGPALLRQGESGEAPVSVVIRTRNRPALVREALESLRAQTARPAQVVLVNDGGAPVDGLREAFRGAFELTLAELPERAGRSHAANRGVSLASRELVTFLDDDDLSYPDHLERLLRAHRSGPEPVVYSDAVTVVYGRREESWQPLHRTLQYSLDFDPDYLLLANYIPLHTLLLPRALFTGVGGFDVKMEYSEDWDFLIRLSFETAFRHVRAVTCEYRVFEGSDGDPFHVPAGQVAFQQARAEIYARYASRRSEEGLARAFDRLRAQIAFCSERDGVSQGELRYQRESHRRLNAMLAQTGERLGKLTAQLSATKQRSEDFEREVASRMAEFAALRTERDRLLAENELVHARVAELFASNEEYNRQIARIQAEVERLEGILSQIYRSRTWKLHLFLERVRGRPA
ncbi:MAG TPA: PIG-L family deacetylase [Thermoanaerobaculia bacterium]|nr:PIG-L family deacetylase [Thermoanaerobaculia bacterium]